MDEVRMLLDFAMATAVAFAIIGGLGKLGLT